MKYPFIPKSNKALKSGQFWPIRLANGNYACGVVVDVYPPTEDDAFVPRLRNRSFLAGLVDWRGEALPTTGDIADRDLLDQGLAHVGTIATDNIGIIGDGPYGPDGIPPLFWVTPISAKSPVRYLYQGFRRIREARPEECEPYFGISAWSQDYIQGRANLRFVEGRVPKADYRTYSPFMLD